MAKLLFHASMLTLTLLFGQVLPLAAKETCDPPATSDGSVFVQRQKSMLKDEFDTGDTDTDAGDQAHKLDKLMLQVEVNTEKEFVDTMTSTGFSMETLASFLESPKTTVKDATGKVYMWPDFLSMYPSQATAKFPLKFRIDTAHQPTRTRSQPHVSLAQAEATIKQFNEEMTEKQSDPAFLAQVVRQKEEMKKQLRANSNASKDQLYNKDETFKMVIKGLDEFFAQKCAQEGEANQSQDCAEFNSCLSMTENVFGENDDLQHPTDDQVDQLVVACQDEEAKVQAELAEMDAPNKEEYIEAANLILPKCQHIGKTMRAYLGSLGDGSVTTRSAFCSYMINYVIPVDKEPPCQRFLELVKAEWMTASGKNLNWPAITQEDGFDAAFQTACAEDGTEDCAAGLPSVKNISNALINRLTLEPLNALESTSKALKLAEIETYYHEEVCHVLGYPDPALTQATVLQLRQRNTVRAANALKFQESKTKILFGALAMATLIDCALSGVAYYHNVNIAAGNMAADVGAGYGYHDKTWAMFVRMARVKTGMFASVCNMIATGIEAEAGVGTVRFSNYDKIAGHSITFMVGGSYNGVGGSAGAAFCCKHGHSLPGSGCHFCGVTISPAFDAEGNDVSAGLVRCYTENLWTLGPVEVVPTGELKNPFCFPGKALVQTPSGAKTMSDLRVGDRVLTVASDNSLAFEDVYFFGHADQYATASYVGLQVGKDVLHLSGDHFVPICRSSAKSCSWEQRIEVYAREVKVGDIMWVRSPAGFSTSTVDDIITSHLSGVFNPYTTSGNIIVDGVVASCHSSWILDALFPKRFQHWLPAVYQMVFLPGRWIYKLFGVAAADLLDMNNPQSSPETFGYGPMFALAAHGAIPTLTMFFLLRRRK